MLKENQSAIIRTIASTTVGALLIVYRAETMRWITIAIGSLFLLSGIVSCISYLLEKEKIKKGNSVLQSTNATLKQSRPLFPILGVGSTLLGVILVLMPETFIKWIVVMLAAWLILGAIMQFVNLAGARQYAHLPFLYWLFPSVTLIVGIVLLVRPIEVAALPLLVIGWCLVFYGVVEFLNTLKIYQMRRIYRKNIQEKMMT